MKGIKDLLTPAFYHAWHALFNPLYTYYIFKGGRNSGKSTFVSRCIILLMMKFPVNALIVRKVANTLSESVYEQLIDSIESLGVNDYWKRSKSPLGLMYIPRGNRIIFRGADDPVKLKSIKSHKFPIAILWIEEVSEFKNEDEVSTIENSVIRAELPEGLKYYIFYSYNPPRALNSWVNVKYNTTLIPSDTYVHHSTVNDNPYLSKQLKATLIELQAKNPERYRWEFLGEAVGSGVMPFDNLVFREITDEEIQGFDNYRCGIDWGYANDAFAYVRWHYDKKHRIIYAVDERYGVRLTDRSNADWLKARRYANDHTYIKADSAEPKTIDLYRNDYNVANIIAATKGPGSVETGEKWLNDEILEIVIDERRTPNIGREFRTIDYARTKDGTILSRLVDLDNHCIAEGTLITTDKGQRPIETLSIGDRVLTRDGFKRVLKVWDNGVRDVVSVKLSNGYSLTATHDHKLFINLDRFVPIDEISYTDTLYCLNKSVAEDAQIVSVQDAGKMQVYDLTVEDSHEYFANGILVHNCIDATRYAFEDDIGVGTYEDYGFMSGGGLI